MPQSPAAAWVDRRAGSVTAWSNAPTPACARSDRLVTVSELCTQPDTNRRGSHLRNPNSPYASVQDAAAAYGFWHMSQFAVDYRELFGERPSDPLKRRLVAA